MSDSEKPFISFVIDGPVAAAKSPTIKLVKEKLEQGGILVATCNPFAKGREVLAGESEVKYLGVYELFTGSVQGAYQAERLLRGIVAKETARTREQLKNSLCDQGVLIWDRGWPTILLSLEDSPLRGTPEESRLSEYWIKNAPPTVFMDTSVEVIKQARGFDRRIPWLSTDELIQNELDRRRRQYRAYQDHFLGEPKFIETRKADLAPIVNDIVEDVHYCLKTA